MGTDRPYIKRSPGVSITCKLYNCIFLLSQYLIQLFLNYRYTSIPEDIAASKMTEDEHGFSLLHPIISPFFSGKKEYKLSLNRANLGRERPDISCTVDNIPILNAEVKPIGCTPRLQKADFIKAHLKCRSSINKQLKEKGGPGESIAFLNMGMYICNE